MFKDTQKIISGFIRVFSNYGQIVNSEFSTMNTTSICRYVYSWSFKFLGLSIFKAPYLLFINLLFKVENILGIAPTCLT